ncbi:PorP/SprF family type IX secretion system membrane protein [Alkalitalea saponilacus]|uniref:Type IX secretion system membrane protein, PorP/SprF family n=1 Tax=Alkalitalea saponilacus TaxID=889453 RepID=A0A1T5G3B1_9BACT|nr:type IX secretion system membrane protein PorP/SprF [Alkalitalea saponilacus]ASB47843.1 hypothetical protein CDL62_01100 [Alkalitalea saponilacus]SKC02955.1 type IX secretion system membrane protein, PorP/SprF family [Alkalitalea saponilacus]
MELKFSQIFSGLLFLMLLLTSNIKSQHDPMLTQYMFNPLILNPAYAGTNGVLTAMAMSRYQWVGFEDAPSTHTFSMHTPVVSRNFGTGFSIIHDQIGPIKNTNAWLDYSYQIYLTDQTRMSLGLKGGFSFYQKDLSRYANDIDITDGYTDSKFLPNFGFGVHVYNHRYYVGLAAPRLIENSMSETDSNESTFISRENRLYLLMAGYAYPLNNELVLRPSFMLRATESAPFNLDLNVNLLIRDLFWVGLLYRTDNVIGGMVRYQVTQQLGLGYAFDTNFGGVSSHFGNTHEAMIIFEFDFRKEQVQNPRYF